MLLKRGHPGVVRRRQRSRGSWKRVAKESYDPRPHGISIWPEMDGFEATEKIRAYRRAERCPIIALTPTPSAGSASACLARG